MSPETAALLKRIQANATTIKRAFVPAPGGQTEPAAGASAMTAAMGSPMGDPAAGGMPPADPAAGGDPMAAMAALGAPPGDPMAAGAPPADPMAAGAPPAAGGDPMADMPPELAALLGGAGGAPAPAPAGGAVTFTVSVPELISLIQVLKGGGGDKPADPTAGEAPAAAKPKGSSTAAKLDQILQAVGGGAPAAAAAPSPTPAPSPAPVA